MTKQAKSTSEMPVEARMPPHDLDAEAAVLSAVVTGDREHFDCARRLLKPEHFYAEAHRRIFEACTALAARGQPIDVVQVSTWLRDRERPPRWAAWRT